MEPTNPRGNVLGESVDWRDHGFPDVPGAHIGDVGSRGWRLFEDVTLPMLAIRGPALRHNLLAMARYCRAHNVDLAPHGKTHMAPQLYWMQQFAGAWAVTVANVAQARVFARTGARRILIANLVVSPADVAWLWAEAQRGTELYVVADSLEAVDSLARGALENATLNVLVELGYPGGRAGCRTPGEARAVAERVTSHASLRLRGLEGYEGVMPGPDARERIGDYLDAAASLLDSLITEGLVTDPIATFGGSAHFDLVVSHLATRDWAAPVRVVLRSGCYLTHDHGLYAESSPGVDGVAFEPALELWASVLSLPEPGLAIVGFGRRDAPTDAGLPVPLAVRRDGEETPASGMEVTGVNDQHAYVRVDPGTELRVGDAVRFGISHPCTTFDKWRTIPVLDKDDRVVDAVRTYF